MARSRTISFLDVRAPPQHGTSLRRHVPAFSPTKFFPPPEFQCTDTAHSRKADDVIVRAPRGSKLLRTGEAARARNRPAPESWMQGQQHRWQLREAGPRGSKRGWEPNAGADRGVRPTPLRWPRDFRTWPARGSIRDCQAPRPGMHGSVALLVVQ